jgi:hypothetical protein
MRSHSRRIAGTVVITFIAAYESTHNFFSTGASDTASVTCGAGDWLLILAGSGNTAQIVSTPSGGGLTYNFANSSGVNLANMNAVYGFTAYCPTAQTFTMTCTISPNNGGGWGFIAYRFAGVSGMGNTLSASSPTSNPPTGSITTTKINSLIGMIITDFTNSATTTPTYVTGAGAYTQQLYVGSGVGTLWVGYYLNAGPATSYTVGISSPSCQFAMIAVELLCAPPPPPSLVVNKALSRSMNY